VADVEEDKPEPDLDELLELFREPEEEPRRKKTRGPVWLMAALILSLVGGWMAALVANRPATKHSPSGPPVLPTKVSDREPRGTKGEPVDVVEDYIARCKKGMTEQEVRWVIEDFQKSGLDWNPRSAPPEEFIRQRKAQQRWYLDLLTDGLRLDPDQRRMAQEKLAAFFDEAVADFQSKLSEKGSGASEQEGALHLLENGGTTKQLVEAGSWLADEKYAPWELCELTEEQVRLTWFGWIDSRRNANPDGLTYEPEMPWFGDRMIEGGPSEDGGWELGDFPTGDAPSDIRGAGDIFPFMSGQKFLLGEGDGVGPIDVQAMGCHPAQLKTLLLLAPGIGEKLLEKLDTAEK
jgi:hypothetical protein